jgi:holo-[acyl-carrier protein] synthase
MIVGIGVDILDSRRIEGIVERQGARFFNKILTNDEQSFCKSRTGVIETFAKIFAIKEAVVKAISDVSKTSWHDIEVLHKSSGKPYICLHNFALKNLLAKTQGKSFAIEVSVSDEIPYVCAFAMIETI